MHCPHGTDIILREFVLWKEKPPEGVLYPLSGLKQGIKTALFGRFYEATRSGLKANAASHRSAADVFLVGTGCCFPEEFPGTLLADFLTSHFVRLRFDWGF